LRRPLARLAAGVVRRIATTRYRTSWPGKCSRLCRRRSDVDAIIEAVPQADSDSVHRGADRRGACANRNQSRIPRRQDKAFNALVGQVMKATKARPIRSSQRLLRSKLG